MIRRLVREPSFLVPLALILCLALGATAAVFTLLHGVVLSPLPYPEAQGLVRLQSAVPKLDPDTRWGLAKAEYLYFSENSTALASLGLYVVSRSTVSSPETGMPQAEQILVGQVSPDLLTVLGVEPLHGRKPTMEDALEPEPRAVWLSYDLWRQAFGGDPDAVGRSLILDGKPVRVEGVLPRTASLPEELRFRHIQVQAWTPLWLDPTQPASLRHTFRAVGRLKEGISLAGARAELARLTERLPEALPAAYSAKFMDQTGFATEVIPLRQDVIGGVSRVLWIVFGATSLLLLVGILNAASLQLARREIRRPEVALRQALGAGRSSLLGLFVVENTATVLLSGCAGVGLAWAGVRLLAWLGPADLPRLDEIHLSFEGILLILGLSVVLTVIFVWLSMPRSMGKLASLREAGRGPTTSAGQQRWRQGLAVVQIAVALVVLVSAGLLWESFRRLGAVQPGFDTQGALSFRLVLPEGAYGGRDEIVAWYRGMTEQLTTLPGVQSAGLTAALPLSGYDGCTSFYPADHPPTSDESAPCIPIFLVGPGYFEAMRIPISGRDFGWDTLQEGAAVAVVSKALAHRFWSGENALGKAVQINPSAPALRVVGVAGDVRANGLDRPAVEAVYVPFAGPTGAQLWNTPRDLAVVVRAQSSSQSELLPLIRHTVADLDANVPLVDVKSLKEVVDRSMGRLTFSALLVGIAAIWVVLLSVLGVYSLLAYLVAKRRAEIGIRMALGASPRRIRWWILGQALRLVLPGLGLGLLGALWSARALGALLFEIQPTDPTTLVSATLALAALAVLASWFPAARATRLLPRQALEDLT